MAAMSKPQCRGPGLHPELSSKVVITVIRGSSLVCKVIGLVVFKSYVAMPRTVRLSPLLLSGNSQRTVPEDSRRGT